MNKGQLPPVKHRQGVIVLECNICTNFDTQYFEVLASIPGNEGVVVATWPMSRGSLAPSHAWDMNTWIEQAVNGALWGRSGTQEVLPL